MAKKTVKSTVKKNSKKIIVRKPKSAVKKVAKKAKVNKKINKIVKKVVKKAVKKVVKKALKKVEKVKLPKKNKTKFAVTITQKRLGSAPEEYHFVLNNGNRLKSIQELTDALETMSEDMFKYHANEYKNDFANWINDVFEEGNLANEIKKAKSRIETRIKLLQRLVDDVVKQGRKRK